MQNKSNGEGNQSNEYLKGIVKPSTVYPQIGDENKYQEYK
jgi:hypothetical protein